MNIATLAVIFGNIYDFKNLKHLIQLYAFELNIRERGKNGIYKTKKRKGSRYARGWCNGNSYLSIPCY